MAVWSFQNSNWTPTATADATNLVNATYMGLKGGSATQLIKVQEFMISGMASASALTALTYAHSSTLAATPTALAAPASNAPMHPSTAALAAAQVAFTAATTPGQRSAAVTDAKINLGLNAFGGIVRWNAAPGQEFWQLGNAVTAQSGECYLSAQNIAGAGLIDAHILYEPL